MAQDNAASISGVAIRLSRLAADGTILAGAKTSYVTKAFISVTITPEYEDGDEFVQKGADGTTCVTFKAPDTLKRVSLQLAICNPDPELTQLATGGTLLADAGETVGWASPEVGVDANPNGIALEVWSRAITNGRPAAVNPYWHWVFPYVQLRQSGDRVIENDILATTFEGWGVGNSGFETGPAAPEWPFDTISPYAMARTDAIPATIGFTPVTP